MASWFNPFSSAESFDGWAKVATGLFVTAGVVITALSWRKGLSRERKRCLTFWERVCFIIGAACFWITLHSGNKVSSEQEARFSNTTNRLAQAVLEIGTQSNELERAKSELTLANQRVEELVRKTKARHLTSLQRTNLINTLINASKFDVYLAVPMQDPEAREFSLEIESALEDSGFQVIQFFNAGILPALGVAIGDNQSPPGSVETLKEALTAAEIPIATDNLKIGPLFKLGSVMLSIGPKP